MKYLSLILVLLLGSAFNQSGSILEKVKIVDVSDLAQNYILVHPDFFLDTDTESGQMIYKDDLTTFFKIIEEDSRLFLYFEVAEQNVLKLSIELNNDGTATLRHFTCDCNIGIERSIFNHNSNPYKNIVATVSVRDNGLFFDYSEEFKRDFLAISTMSKAYFKSEYSVYNMK